MGLTDRARRLHYVYSWRLRYWWMDTESGKRAHIVMFAITVLITIAQMAKLGVAAALPQAADAPARALVWWVVQLIMLAISAILSYALRPKVEAPKPVDGKAPTVEDGQAALEVYGEYWIDDEFILAHKPVGTEKIKSKGKK